jgi:Polyketide cyclase / dehydrase and lipid transport
VTVHLVVSEELPAPAEAAFDLLHDYSRRLQWDTLLRAASVDATPIAVGTGGVCTARRWLGGYSFHFRYVTFRRPEVAAVHLTSRPPFFTSWAASIRHRPLDGRRSLITYTMTFQCRPRLVEPIAKGIFRRETRRRLHALARALLAD